MTESSDWRARLKRLREVHAEADDDEAAEMVLVAAVNSSTGLELLSKKRGGSRPGRSANVERDHAAGLQRLYQDYFASDPVYNARLFRRRFRMPPRVFHRLMNGVLEMDDYFRQKTDAAGEPGLSPLQKVTEVLRMYCYGIAADATDEYVRLRVSTAAEAFQRFTKAMLAKFGAE